MTTIDRQAVASKTLRLAMLLERPGRKQAFRDEWATKLREMHALLSDAPGTHLDDFRMIGHHLMRWMDWDDQLRYQSRDVEEMAADIQAAFAQLVRQEERL